MSVLLKQFLKVPSVCPHGAGWDLAGRRGTITFVEPFGKRSDDSLEEKTRLSVLETGSLEVGTAHVGFVQLLVMSPSVDATVPHSASGNTQTLPSPPALNPVSDIWGSCFRYRAVVSNVWSPDQLGQHLLGTSELRGGPPGDSGTHPLQAQKRLLQASSALPHPHQDFYVNTH